MPLSRWANSWGKSWGASWGVVHTAQAQPAFKDPYRDIAARVFNGRVDGPGNAIYIRTAQRRPRRR